MTEFFGIVTDVNYCLLGGADAITIAQTLKKTITFKARGHFFRKTRIEFESERRPHLLEGHIAFVQKHLFGTSIITIMKDRRLSLS